MPTLRYYIGNSSNTNIQQITRTSLDVEEINNQPTPIILRWKTIANAKIYRLEIVDETDKNVFSAVVLPSTEQYRLPSFIRELTASKQLKWRMIAVDSGGKTLEESKFSEVK